MQSIPTRVWGITYIFKLSKSYANLLHVEPSSLLFLKTYKKEFDDITITFMDWTGTPLELEDKVNLSLHTNSTLFYRTENKTVCQRIRTLVICKKSIW